MSAFLLTLGFLEFDLDLGNFLEGKMALYTSVTVSIRKELIGELLYGIDNETLAALLKYKKTALASPIGARYCFFWGSN